MIFDVAVGWVDLITTRIAYHTTRNSVKSFETELRSPKSAASAEEDLISVRFLWLELQLRTIHSSQHVHVVLLSRNPDLWEGK